MNKIATIDLKGKDYARVPDRIKAFREDCPNGVIRTKPTVEDGQIIFEAFVKKDQSKVESAESTGHSFGKLSGDKSFEKQETIAIGRALATLGYMAGGDVASSEEMEEFYEYRNTQIDEAVVLLLQATDMDELKEVFMSLGNLISDKRIREAKDKRKEELNASN